MIASHPAAHLWNTIEKSYPDKTITQLVAEQVEKTPDALAVICGEQQITYRQLDTRANQLAHYLRAQNLKTEVLVAICMERSIDLVVSLLAVLKAGGAYLPIDPHYPLERILYMLDDSKAELLLTQKKISQLLAGTTAKIIDIDHLSIHNNMERCAIDEAKTDCLAYVIYTSGSTGKPKGVMITHQAICHRLLWFKDYFPYSSADKWLHAYSFSFDGAVAALWWPLVGGATVVLPTQEMFQYLNDLPALIKQHQINVLFTTPSLFNVILSDFENKDYHHLPNKLIFGGEALNTKLIEKIFHPERRIFNFYGPTEASVLATAYQISQIPKSSAIVPIGKAITNVKTYLLNEALQPVPIGEIGELYIGGIGLARGYINQPTLTAEKFITYSFNNMTHERLYKTGDLACYQQDGTFEYVGRIDHQVKIRGFRIELGEIEATLINHPAVKECVVLAQDDKHEEKQLIAYVVLQAGKTLQLKQMRKYLHQQLPNYMLPNALVNLTSLPLTPNGKIDRKNLPLPTYERQQNFIMPRNEDEKYWITVWSNLLKINANEIGVRDNFFELGGYSLLFTQLILLVKKQFNDEFPFAEFLSNPTIEKLVNLHKSAGNITADNTLLFANDIHLADDFKSAAFTTESTKKHSVKTILLTGATGFLGAHLLKEFADTNNIIYCLVNTKMQFTPQAYLKHKLANFNLQALANNERIIAINGDLSKTNLGLSDTEFAQLSGEIDMIYHCGAQVNHLADYSQLRQTNVLGTIELMKLAANLKIKPFIFISTLSACNDLDEFEHYQEIFPEFSPQNIQSGYAASKWVTEKLLKTFRDKNYPVTIFRPNQIIGGDSGFMPSENIHFLMFIKGCLQMGYFPETFREIDILPVNFIAQFIVLSTLKQPAKEKIFNISNKIATEVLYQCISAAGHPFHIVPYAKWRETLLQSNKENALYPLLPLYLADEKVLFSTHSYRTENMQTMLQQLKIQMPAIDASLINPFI